MRDIRDAGVLGAEVKGGVSLGEVGHLVCSEEDCESLDGLCLVIFFFLKSLSFSPLWRLLVRTVASLTTPC